MVQISPDHESLFIKWASIWHGECDPGNCDAAKALKEYEKGTLTLQRLADEIEETDDESEESWIAYLEENSKPD